MSPPTLFSVIESPAHPNFSPLYRRLGINEVKLNSVRKTISELKKQKPDFVVAEFSYGYSSNYAGVNISNLDVLLASLARYAPNARVIVMVDKSEQQHVSKLSDIFPLHAVVRFPVQESRMEALLTEKHGAC